MTINQKKIIIILLCLAGILAVVKIIISLQNHPSTSNEAHPTSIPAPLIPPPNPIVSQKSIRVDNNSNYVFIETGDYKIIYMAETNTYLIFITNPLFDTYRTQAENELIKTLNITPAEACQLTISITTPRFANPDLAGQVFKPSFCL